MPWLTPLWLAGVWFFALAQVAGWVSIRRLKRRGVCSAPDPWQLRFTDLRARLRLSRPVLRLESCLAEVPMVVGHVRPVVLLPLGVLTGLPTGQVEAILLHELAHVRRCDYLANVVQRAVECLLFYHPAVWWISRVIRAERENCCDDMVVATQGDAQEYAEALATLEQSRWSVREPALAASGGRLLERVRRLLYPQRSHTSWTPLLAAVIVITTAVVAFAAWPAQALQQTSAPASRQSARAETAPYKKWLTEEVPYIITDEERTAFLKLETDEEREAFITAFWERRNPHPGSAENAFRVEYYRRLAYATRHFATTSGKAGWRTDRGRMYIMYGPPDEIDSHPAGKPHPFEQWRYRHVDGVGDNVVLWFVDWKGDHDLHLELRPTHGQ